jgi:tetratricopeptide (TPR) repeat protein
MKQLGPNHPSTLAALNSLSVAYMDAGRTTEAIAVLEQVREARVQQLGADHADTYTTLHNLAGAYEAAGRTPEAIALYEQVRDARVKQFGAAHPQTLNTLTFLAGTYLDVGRTPEAIALYEQVREARVKKPGADIPEALRTLHGLALAYHAAGKMEQALSLFQEAAAGVEKHQFKLRSAKWIIHNLCLCLELLGQYDQAEAWRRKWLAAAQANHGPESLEYACVRGLTGLGSNLLQQKKYADAESILRESLVVLETKAPEVWDRFVAQSMLGAALLGRKKYAEAEPHLVQGYQGMNKTAPSRGDRSLPPTPGQLRTEGLERLVQLYDAWGKPDQATKWRKELETHTQDADKLAKPKQN